MTNEFLEHGFRSDLPAVGDKDVLLCAADDCESFIFMSCKMQQYFCELAGRLKDNIIDTWWTKQSLEQRAGWRHKKGRT